MLAALGAPPRRRRGRGVDALEPVSLTRASEWPDVSDPLLSEIRVVNFRTARRLVLRPGPVCAFIGEPGAGKSNLLFALRALLDPSFDLSTADVTAGERAISIEATLADGRTVSLDDRASGPPIVHFRPRCAAVSSSRRRPARGPRTACTR